MEDTQPVQRFYDPDQFDFLKPVRLRWRDILSEFEELDSSCLHPWPERNLFTRYNPGGKSQAGEGWNVFGLWAFGKKRCENTVRCPITTSIVEALPFEVTTVAFSILVPGAHILPHSGYLGYSDRILRCHICLREPKGALVEGCQIPSEQLKRINDRSKSWFERSIWPFDCFQKRYGACLRVEDKATTWKEGEMLIFDDTLLHEAWNLTDEPRVILIIDFKRPPEYMPEQQYFSAITEIERQAPFKNGNRGDQYLDVLTNDFYAE